VNSVLDWDLQMPSRRSNDLAAFAFLVKSFIGYAALRTALRRARSSTAAAEILHTLSIFLAGSRCA
jgi:hypothetical protein